MPGSREGVLEVEKPRVHHRKLKVENGITGVQYTIEFSRAWVGSVLRHTV
jgi:hypothetical protein